MIMTLTKKVFSPG